MSKEVLSNLKGVEYDIPNMQLIGKLAKNNNLEVFDSSEEALAYSSAVSLILELDPENLEKIEKVYLSKNTEDNSDKFDVSDDVFKYLKTQSKKIQLLVKDKHLELTESDLGTDSNVSLRVTHHSLGENIEVLMGDKVVDITDYSNF